VREPQLLAAEHVDGDDMQRGVGPDVTSAFDAT
jgi:hypothetical protein